MIETAEKTFSFAEFEVDAAKRLLLKDGQPVALNPKTFDLLLTLVENRGEVVHKNDLLDKVWANQFVEENNLTVHISALRKVLGERKNEHRFLVTVPGRGYKFVADVQTPQDEKEIVIESHKFSRVLIEEDIVKKGENEKLFDWLNGQTPKAIANVEISERRKTWIEWLKLNPIMTTLLGAFLLLGAIGGGFVWQKQRQSNLPPAVPFAQAQVKQLTTNGKVSIAALSPDGKLFAYVVDDAGKRSLWLGQIEGGNDIELRPPMEVRYHTLAFSPNANFVFFSMRDDANPNSALFKVPALGGASEKIADSIQYFALSPDGKKIAFVRRNDEDKKDSLVIANTDGSEKREIASSPQSQSFISDSVSWSADGKRIALSGVKEDKIDRQEIVIIEIATGGQQRINNKEWSEISKTAWLKDGSGLIMTALKGSFWSSVPQYHLFHLEISSGDSREITSDLSNYTSSLSLSAASDSLLTVEHRQLNNVWIAPANDLSQAKQITFGSFGKYDGLWGLDFTPDGKIIYTNSDTQSQFVSQMNSDGTDSKPLTAPGAIDSVLNVSNDGRYIVFHSNRAGGFDVWRMDAGGANPKQLTFGGKNYQPFVSPDSRYVYYKSWEKKHRRTAARFDWRRRA